MPAVRKVSHRIFGKNFLPSEFDCAKVETDPKQGNRRGNHVKDENDIIYSSQPASYYNRPIQQQFGVLKFVL